MALFSKEWSFEEDMLILKTIEAKGKKWSNIAKVLKGRHENGVKNRYISIIKYLKKTNAHINFDDISEILSAYKHNKQEIRPFEFKDDFPTQII